MRKGLFLIPVLTLVCLTFYLISCNSGTDAKKDDSSANTASKQMTMDEMVKRGDYIVTTGSCNDCHSPKVMTPMGPVPDSTKLLSGHPSGAPLPPFSASSLKPGNWLSFSPDITTFIGPWGISYAANLTPDSATGTGTWTEQQFLNTVRNGKHLGNGRDIMPPMPWQFIGKLTDDDLKSVFAYLRSLPAISNRVPGPVAPPDAEKLAAGK